MTQPAYSLDAARQAFPITEHLTYLNHASISPLPRPTLEIVHQAADRLASDPASFFMPGPDLLADVFTRFSTELAAFVNAERPHEVVPLTSTSGGMNVLARVVDWSPGDNVIMCDVEFPSNVYPFMALAGQGVELRLVPADQGGLSLAALERAADRRTRVVVVSSVQFFSGHRADLAALGAFCRARGILFVVDAIQSAGHIPIDVQAGQIDVLLAGGQKSLMSAPGVGLMYVREAAAERLKFLSVGANAVEGWEHWLRYDLAPRPAALRFYMGTPSLLDMVALLASVRFLSELGLPDIDVWTSHLTALAIDDLRARGFEVITPDDPALRGPIVTFRVPGADLAQANATAAAYLDALNAANVRITRHLDAAGWPHIRISPHCYNTEDEVLRAGAVIQEIRL
ncbi:MAG: aminotransferase class V-fold PLP-dependent enzyme [Anaerolineae bacterium]|nr:aminotransferase class V-fold PLP-dependent enzyme [Anaerolineae bacterium]